MISNQPNQTVREKLLPFDGIEARQSQPIRQSGLAKALRRERQNYQKNVTARLRLLSKVRDPSFELPSLPKTKIQIFLDDLDEKYPLLKPESTFIFYWNMFILIDVIINFFEIPVSVFMTQQVYIDEFDNPAPLAVNVIFLVALIVDTFFIRFNLAFYKNAKLVTSRSQIFDRYIKFQFWIDLITTIVLFVYIAGRQPKLIYVKIVFYLKIISLLRIDQQILNYLLIYRIGKGMYKLFRIVLLIWFITTWVSAAYFGMDYVWYQENGFYRRTGQLWLTNSNAVDNINLIQVFPKQWYIWYEYAIYWSLQTSATVGYGNMTPRNPHEVLYCDFIIVLNTVLFAFYINSIWQIIGEMQEAEQRYADNWSNLKQLIKSEQLPEKTSLKISDYFHEIWMDEDKQQIQQKLQESLSEDLNIELNLTAKQRFYKKIPLFDQLDGFSPLTTSFFKKLVFCIEKSNSPLHQDIYTHLDDSQNLYYLIRGKVQLYAHQILAYDVVVINQNFGIQQFITETPRSYSARAISFCSYFKLSLSNFKATLKEFPLLNEYYSSLRHHIVYEQQYSLLNIACLFCKSKNHLLSECKSLNIWRKKLRQPLQVIKAYHSGTDCGREKSERRRVESVKIRGAVLKKYLQADRINNYQGYHRSFNLH